MGLLVKVEHRAATRICPTVFLLGLRGVNTIFQSRIQQISGHWETLLAKVLKRFLFLTFHLLFFVFRKLIHSLEQLIRVEVIIAWFRIRAAILCILLGYIPIFNFHYLESALELVWIKVGAPIARHTLKQVPPCRYLTEATLACAVLGLELNHMLGLKIFSALLTVAELDTGVRRQINF